MFGDSLREFHRPGLEAAGDGDEWTDTRPTHTPTARRWPPLDLRCPHGRNFCWLCDGDDAS